MPRPFGCEAGPIALFPAPEQVRSKGTRMGKHHQKTHQDIKALCWKQAVTLEVAVEAEGQSKGHVPRRRKQRHSRITSESKASWRHKKGVLTSQQTNHGKCPAVIRTRLWTHFESQMTRQRQLACHQQAGYEHGRRNSKRCGTPNQWRSQAGGHLAGWAVLPRAHGSCVKGGGHRGDLHGNGVGWPTPATHGG